MMDDISKQIKAGEVSGVQFKERILDKYDIACELVAFSNSHGGKLVVGILKSATLLKSQSVAAQTAKNAIFLVRTDFLPCVG